MREPGHYIQFFDGNDGFVRTVSEFVREGIEAGCTCIVAATADHHEQIGARLRELGLNTAVLAAEYRYIVLDAHSTLTTLIHDGKIDRRRFHDDMGQLMRQAASRGQPVYACGEIAPTLMAQGTAATAIEMEDLWNELSRHFSFTMLCAYAQSSFAHDSNGRAMRKLCAIHSHVIPASQH